jgi:DNA-binding beta-propeller fold protein YncE
MPQSWHGPTVRASPKNELSQSDHCTSAGLLQPVCSLVNEHKEVNMIHVTRWLAVVLLVGVGGSPGAQAQGDSGEVWVTSQGTHRLFIVHGNGALVETVLLPAGAGPHLTTFSPLGDYAYVSGMGNGDLYVLRTDSRQLIAVLDFGPAGTHQARPSPDGSLLLVAQIASKTLVKVAADEVAETWSVLDALPLDKAPVCSVFRDDGQRAYVSLLPDGIAVVDVPTMTLVGTLATDGFVACGMEMSKKGRIITLASSGGGGHIYRLDTADDTLASLGTLGASDWHSFRMSTNEKIGFGSAPHADALVLTDLTGPVAIPLGTFALDPTPGTGNDEPDNMAVRGSTVFASLRASGKLAIAQPLQGKVTYVDLADPAPFNPANCSGCSVHGVAIRP